MTTKYGKSIRHSKISKKAEIEAREGRGFYELMNGYRIPKPQTPEEFISSTRTQTTEEVFREQDNEMTGTGD